MSERSTVLQGARVGPESSYGAGGNAPVSLRTMNVQLSPNPETGEVRTQGYRVPVGNYNIREWTDFSMSGMPDYNEIGFPLSMLEAPSTATIASGVYRHTFTPNVRGCTDPQSHVIEQGDDCSTQFEKVAAAVLSQFGMTFSRGSIEMSGSGFAQSVDLDPTPTVGASEVQTATISGTPTGGTFNLAYKGQVTTGLAYNASAANVQAALVALSTIGTGNVAVSGSAGGPYTITFQGALAGLPQELISVAQNDLTGGTSPGVTITKTTRGGYTEYDLAPIEPGQGVSYLHTTYAGAISTANPVSKAATIELACGSGITPQWVHGTTEIAGHIEGQASFTLNVTMQADAAGKDVYANLRNGQLVYWRTRFTGAAISGGHNYYLDVLIPCKVNGPVPIGDTDGMYAFTFTLTAIYDASLGHSIKIELQNKVASYS